MDSLAALYTRWLMIAPFREEGGRVAYYPRGRARPGLWLPKGDPMLRRLRRVSFGSMASLMVAIVPGVAVLGWAGLLPALVLVPLCMVLQRRAESALDAGSYEPAPAGWLPAEKRRFWIALGGLALVFVVVLATGLVADP